MATGIMRSWRAVDDERRRLDALQPPVAVVQRRGEQLRAVGLLGERMREPAADVLGDPVLVLAPAARAVVERHRRPRGLLGGVMRRAAAEEREHLGARAHGARPAGVRRAEDERAHAPRVAQRELLGDHAAEREAVHVRPLDAGGVEHRDGVVGHRLGRVAVASARASGRRRGCRT